MTNQWINLVVSLPGKNQALRMRVWRKIKTLGAGILRDGAYLLPNIANHFNNLEQLASEVILNEGVAHLIQFNSIDDEQESLFKSLFDRSEEYSILLQSLEELKKLLHSLTENDARKQLNALIREFDCLGNIDFFPSEGRKNVERAIKEIESVILSRFSPDEPTAVNATIAVKDINQYQNQHWITRQHMWIDRVASAWLIKTFIDKNPSFHWVDNPQKYLDMGIGFDFDGAEFSHVGEKITFEVMIHNFELQNEPGLMRLAELIHYLDVGGIPIPEAKGLEILLIGAREKCTDDAQLLNEMSMIFEFFIAGFTINLDTNASNSTN
ncbi:MAG: chromate resistance protein [Gammaproteobacteria bacterium]|nr:chromate resistance protein [Gammaproteobacteria bacterium]